MAPRQSIKRGTTATGELDLEKERIELLKQRKIKEEGEEGFIGPIRQPSPEGVNPPDKTFRDDKGNIIALLVDGKFLPFGNPDEARAFVERRNRIEATPEGFLEAGDAADLRRRQESLKSLGQVDTSLQEDLTEADINLSQALFAGGVGNLPSALTTGAALGGAALLGGKTGALTGAAGGPVGIAVGAGVGIAIGIFAGVLKNIETQKRGEIGAADEVLTFARTNMRQLAMLATENPANADKYIDLYNQQLSLVHQARRQIKIETTGDSNAYIEDGRDILSGFDLFLDPDTGTASIYEEKLRNALNSDEVVQLTEADLPT